MADINWTVDQLAAIQECGRGVVVAAAAGSGKTAVLAERCAYLVCDAPASTRCSVDRLLVVTFTEAAAAEMKNRIRSNLLTRLEAKPRDAYLREQVGLLETAQISTVHAFCNWLIRRWFNKVEIDPAASVLPADESRILKAETLEEIVAGLYAGGDEASERFRDLVNVYGLGRDDGIRAFARRLADHLDSLPDPEAWLADTQQRLIGGDDQLRRFVLDPMRHELSLQLSAAGGFEHLADSADRCLAFYGDLFAQHSAALYEWTETLEKIVSSHAPGERDGRFEELRKQIAEHALSARGAPRKSKDASDDEIAVQDAVRDAYKTMSSRFQKRLRDRFALFTPDEVLDGLQTTAPHVAAMVELVNSFRTAYAAAKRRRDVLDFADQESFAYKLVQDDEVATAVRKRFAHVLVDEYQDINPLQDALLRRVSRDDVPESEANLFSVGDVKQSIYRFRAADPDVFRDRIAACADDAGRSRMILLRENFRSRAAILEAANALFSQLMQRSVAGIDYDDDHALRPGRKVPDSDTRWPVDVHLLDRKITTTTVSDDDEADEQSFVDSEDPAEWQAIEREAYVIGTEIRRLISEGMTVDGDRPLTPGDVAVLLRSPAYRGSVMAEVLQRMGIEAVSHAGGTLFDQAEIRDVRALLATLDNAQQDIPLATVMRSRVLGDAFTEDELSAIRSLEMDAPFHETVRRYAREGKNEALRSRLITALDRLNRYRRAMRERPFAEVLWEMLEQTGYAAYVGGLRGGAQRKSNLMRLHERARQFDTFRQQGLRRFLRFVETLEETEQDLGSAPPPTPGDDAVRIMSIHSSKGLEFPVVFVADLGRRMNLRDRHGRMILDRDAGIGLRVVDPKRKLEYPSAAHTLAAAGIDSATRAEELRLLYVAVTRARDKLILVGTTDLDALRVTFRKSKTEAGDGLRLSPLSIQAAMDPLDWVVPALATMRDNVVRWPGRTVDAPLFAVHAHNGDAMRDWRIESRSRRGVSAFDRAIAGLQALPAEEPQSADRSSAETLIERVLSDYPHMAAASVRSVMAASEVRHVHDALRDPDEQLRDARRTGSAGVDRDQAARRGTATHALMQHMNLAVVSDAPSVRVELERSVAAGLLSADDATLIDVESIAWFLDTPLGHSVRTAGDAYRREFMFVAAHPAGWFADCVGDDSDEKVLVRGVADGVLPREGGIEIIDFKTDVVSEKQTLQRTERYSSQIRLYAASLAPVFEQPVNHCWLVFLNAREVVAVSPD